MARWSLLFLILLVIPGRAAVSSARAKTLARYKASCDSGSGKACYDYGRALWSTPGAIDRKKAKHYLFRGCELGYKLACAAYRDHSTHTVHVYKSGPNVHTCFTSSEMSRARFTSSAKTDPGTSGQRIDKIQVNSFWSKAGMLENDVLVRVNNLPFSSDGDMAQAFAKSGKKFGFEVRRNGETITLWYSCGAG